MSVEKTAIQPKYWWGAPGLMLRREGIVQGVFRQATHPLFNASRHTAPSALYSQRSKITVFRKLHTVIFFSIGLPCLATSLEKINTFENRKPKNPRVSLLLPINTIALLLQVSRIPSPTGYRLRKQSLPCCMSLVFMSWLPLAPVVLFLRLFYKFLV